MTTPNPAQITPDVAAHVLFWSGNPGGYPPGSFTQNLLAAWNYADPRNHDRLAAGFPEYATAIDLLHASGGVAVLQAVVKGERA